MHTRYVLQHEGECYYTDADGRDDLFTDNLEEAEVYDSTARANERLRELERNGFPGFRVEELV